MVPVIFERRCDEPKTFDILFDLVRRGRPCLEMYQCTPLIHGISGDGLRFLCLYEAPDAEAVRRSVEAMGNPVETSTWTVTAKYMDRFDRTALPWTRQAGPRSAHGSGAPGEVGGPCRPPTRLAPCAAPQLCDEALHEDRRSAAGSAGSWTSIDRVDARVRTGE